MASQIWLKTYRESGIPAEIDPNAHRSVVAMLEAAMKTHAGKPAFHSFGQTLTYADVDRQSRNFAAYLQKKLGVKKGDRIAVMMPNLLAFPVAFSASFAPAQPRSTSTRFIRRANWSTSSRTPASGSWWCSRVRRRR